MFARPVLFDFQEEWLTPDAHVAKLLRSAPRAAHLDDAVIWPQRYARIGLVPRRERAAGNIADQLLTSENLEMSGAPVDGVGLCQVEMDVKRADLCNTCGTAWFTLLLFGVQIA